ncbi:MAG: radical SAM protein [Candidatus Omnitrophica bacterium]|jgi:wyosine [tRNA(Phe)-imidazoG37] synthetase (radical SAM superfamily)|nr:radical SAM protein [Candidatus Omnitrophota bacterium]
MAYFYGPVFSRRLGFSLGVDLFPKKICSMDCLYCQLGKSKTKSIKRFSCIDLKRFQRELKTIIKTTPRIDYITISGSGEPTLHKDLDKIIAAIKKITKQKFPVSVITNSSLLYRKDVRRELRKADLIIPSLDAACTKTFGKINRPHKKLTFQKILKGIKLLSQEFKGKIWLEIMLVRGINDNIEEARKFNRLIKNIKPDKIQLNLPIRPSAFKVSLPSRQKIAVIARIIAKDIEIVTAFPLRKKKFKKSKNLSYKIIDFLKSRPATAEDLAVSLATGIKNINLAISYLLEKRQIRKRRFNQKEYFILYD